ncbi:hypothetical protein [Veillonella sp. VA139]|uniref:hypothetical protein n=1 Tax=Veillonella sp. VA139 TaxID=741830 RepID=UPI000F8E40F0|nr:hypothetical protein [Veillonella sp. VA139]
MGNVFITFAVVVAIIEGLIRTFSKNVTGSFRYLFYILTTLCIIFIPNESPTYTDSFGHTFARALGVLIFYFVISGVGTAIAWGIAKLLGIAKKRG